MSVKIFAVNISAQLNNPIDDWLKFRNVPIMGTNVLLFSQLPNIIGSFFIYKVHGKNFKRTSFNFFEVAKKINFFRQKKINVDYLNKTHKIKRR